MKQLRRFRYLAIVIAFLFLAGCPMFTKDINVTTTDKLTYMYKIYNAQYEDYLSMAANPNTSEAQKVIMRKKKPILDSLAVLIPAFDKSIQGGTNTPQQEQAIYDLINSLGEE